MVQTHRIKTIAIVGCTAVGKSETALRLARKYNGIIIGADSMQIYRNFDIGTGKLTPSECGGIEHKMIDIVDGDSEFSVGEYVELAKKEIADADRAGKLPIIVGGTGLYIYALLSGCDFGSAPKNDGVRSSLKLSSHILGSAVLHRLLCIVDEPSAKKISVNDIKRTIRALEIYAVKGEPKSSAVNVDKTAPYDSLTVVLTLPRDILYKRIDERVRRMFDAGLIAEAKGLLQYANYQSMQALGYKQIASDIYASRAELETITAQKTRNYAKRQTTYFKNMKLNKVFIDARDYEAVEKCVDSFLE